VRGGKILYYSGLLDIYRRQSRILPCRFPRRAGRFLAGNKGRLMTTVSKGTWVEIEQVILTPAQRAATVPDDTRQTPLVMRVSGFLTADIALAVAETASAVTIRTIIGRELTGKLVTVNPFYSHSFGATMPELLTIGTLYEGAGVQR